MITLEVLKNFLFDSKFFYCKSCGYKLPKNEAVISGWTCQQTLRHVHCPSCGKVMGYLK